MRYNDKQLQIILTAEKLFSTRGFDGTSVRDIAQEAGVNLAMINYYFGSKEKLMQAVFEERTSDIRLRLEGLVKNQTLSPIDKVYELVDDYVNKVLQKQQFFRIMVCEQMMEKNPAIIKLLYDLKKGNAELVEELIKEGQEKGTFKKDVDVVLVMNTIIGTVLQTFINQDYYKYYHGLEEMQEEAFFDLMKKKLSNHIKVVLKATLSYEA
jgi:AcrR family transcriptional regulator